MIKQRLKNLVLALSPVIKPLIMIKNRILAKNDWVLVLGGHSYAMELVQELWQLKYKIYLIDAAPNSLNWRFASGSTSTDLYDPKNISQIITIAKRLGCRSALMQSDDKLLPIIAEINQKLDSPSTFSSTAIRSSINKEVMRNQFVSAGMTLPKWHKLEINEVQSDILLPYIIKPLIGQGSKGVAYVSDMQGAERALAFIKDEMHQDQYLIEEYLPDRQFNVDGIILNGKPFFHMIAEEHFADFVPIFKSCWYLFGVTLSDKMRHEIIRETSEALSAANFQSGAFHVEVKFKGERAYAIDISNRMPADFPKYAKLVYEVSLVEDYLKVMHGQQIEQRPMEIKRSHLRFYNYPERIHNKKIDDLAQAKADAGILRLTRDGIQLEMTADKEDILRKFLDEVYALRDNT